MTEAETTAAPLLAVRNLVTGYGDLRVVWDVSFDVLPGQVTALLGRNGAGKTTTLRAIAGLNKMHGGSVRLAGEDVDGLAPHRRIRAGLGVVQENKRVFKRRSVEDNLLLGGYTGRRAGRRKLKGALEEIYELFPALRGRAGTPAGQLSGGQQQMLAIGQAIMGRPKLLMLDEPSAGLAPAIVLEVMSSVARLKESGLGILLVEQAVEAAVSVADHVAVLDVGRIVMESPVGMIDDLRIIKDAYFGRAGAQPE
ncbi:ABC transporter ATP-binding protein [Amycolatopsis sp.]|uniref:ABC transporter ATP-binding protein n=1 Tax=Amycolatopsis sp. TaxID=37632 RepID=UPI002C32C46F|nr:ABC transporter ATP-binding protein [Amycolatopsis sp.]HVV10474.1 ABC transporter ATP-binding protein [Amycolatopsis sp.]